MPVLFLPWFLCAESELHLPSSTEWIWTCDRSKDILSDWGWSSTNCRLQWWYSSGWVHQCANCYLQFKVSVLCKLFHQGRSKGFAVVYCILMIFAGRRFSRQSPSVCRCLLAKTGVSFVFGQSLYISISRWQPFFIMAEVSYVREPGWAYMQESFSLRRS